MIRRALQRGLASALCVALGACASMPATTPHPTAITRPAITIGSTPGLANAGSLVLQPQGSDLWNQLRGSFAMADCDADPQIQAWARRYTSNPQRFENQLREVLPLLAYVQQVASQHAVAGEFVLLPWVESHFQPLPGHWRRPAGMWQIMPATASSMRLRVNSRYDGRLDTVAATQAVMKLLRQYHEQLHDWRIVDYAYNAGEFGIGKLIQQHGMPADEPVIPRWPVRRITREHLTKLLAIACVVREPDRFGVTLPTLPPPQQLVQVDLPRSMPLATAAALAGISTGQLKDLNAAFHSSLIDIRDAPYLLLPASQQQQFQNALRQPANAAVAVSESRGRTEGETASSDTVHAVASAKRTKVHTVRRGESLWQIAHHYSVNVAELQRWNHLHGHALRPGTVLRVRAAE